MINKNLIILVLMIFVTISIFTKEDKVVPVFRISTENNISHVQTKAIQEFANILKEKVGDKLKIKFFHSSQLYRDSQVLQAMSMDRVEMAVPGTWNISALVPEVSYFLFPDFYGEKAIKSYDFINSELGYELINIVEETLDVKVIGNFMDLGFAHLFTTENRLDKYSDLNGLRIRVAGGIVNKLRVETLGAQGVIIPWADVKTSLNNKSIDGLLTTFESVRSSELWNYGVKYVYEDYEYFPQYIPLISKTFWNNLSPNLQNTIIETWNDIVVTQKENAIISQENAKRIAIEEGLIIVIPTYQEISKAKKKLLATHNNIVNVTGIKDYISYRDVE